VEDPDRWAKAVGERLDRLGKVFSNLVLLARKLACDLREARATIARLEAELARLKGQKAS
jgi:hypothetical protein